MSTKHHISLDDVRGAKPTFRPTAEEWVDSERGRDVLERVLEADRAAHATVYRAQGRRKAWLTVPRLAFAGGFVMIAALAVALALVFTGNGGSPGSGPVASTQTSVGSDQVTLEAALSDIMPLYILQTSAVGDSNTTSEGVSPVQKATLWGLISKAEAGAAASTRLTNGAYAVFLAKAFRMSFFAGDSAAQAVDPAATPEERSAIELLMKAGVILPGDGDFPVRQILSVEVERRLLGRVQSIVESYSN